ncbi:MAG: type II toxin-antitoxin system VapC family toxin [Desulfobacteraceae bacterium]|jgi:tRNA(fMet)-specific endonuclease VapC
MKYLLDTNVISEAVKKDPDKNVMDMLEKHGDEIVTASPVWHELQYGCRLLPQSRKKKIISSFLNDVVIKSIPILPYNENSAELHAEERARLTLKGVTPAFVDGQIASIAIINNLILVTRNVSDFKKLKNIKLENWYNSRPAIK